MDDQSRTMPSSAATTTDDDEWEYEYSTAPGDVETHYITLDLSVPELLDSREDYIVHNTRGGYRSWVNPLLYADKNGDKNGDGEQGRDPGVPIEDKILPIEEEEDDGEEPEREEPEDDDDEHPFERRRISLALAHAMRVPPTTQSEDATEIQILDLHHENPIVSYRGTLYNASWSTPIGTELVFTPHDDKNPQPALRNLAQKVDLLAASSARITCTPTEHKRRHPQKLAQRMRHVRDINGFAIPMHSDTYEERQPQAYFIETLMAIKKLKGETDEVTVYGEDTSHNAVTNDEEEELWRKRNLRQKRGSSIRYMRSQKKKGKEKVATRNLLSIGDGVRVHKRGGGRNGGGPSRMREKSLSSTRAEGLPDVMEVADD